MQAMHSAAFARRPTGRRTARTAGSITPDDLRARLAAGVTRAQIEDALDVAWAVHVINRLADAFEFAVPSPAGLAGVAKTLLTRGYRL